MIYAFDNKDAWTRTLKMFFEKEPKRTDILAFEIGAIASFQTQLNILL